MEKKINRLSQRYSDSELKLIKDEAKKQKLGVATLIRKLTLDSIVGLNK